MRKNRKKFAALLLAGLMALSLMTASAVDVEKDKGSITLTILTDSGGNATNAEVAVYQVGVGRIENSNLYFDLLDALKPAEGEEAVELNGLNAQQNQEAAAKLYAKLQALPADAVPTFEGVTDRQGVIRFEDLSVGVYLVVQTAGSSSYVNFDSFLIYLPSTSPDGVEWDYTLEAGPKVEIRPGGGGEDPVPPPIDPPPVIPPDPGVDVPDPEVPVDPGIEIPEPEVPLEPTLPQTGMLMWPIPLMAMAGLVLFAAGWITERKAKKC